MSVELFSPQFPNEEFDFIAPVIPISDAVGSLVSGDIVNPSTVEDSPPALKLVESVRVVPEAKPKFKIRSARPEDIPAIVDVDMKAFDSVYESYDSAQNGELRRELIEKFAGRLSMVGGEWMPVLEREGEIVGFMTSCPTSKSPEDFESWEKTTDNGSLATTYDPNGKNVYVVTLSVLPEGPRGKNMLFAHSIGKMMREGYDKGYFESRLPGLRDWVEGECDANGRLIESLSVEELDVYAKNYFNSTTNIRGKEVRQDRLIRLYESVGCKCLDLVSNAYEDEPSMNYGVVCVYDGEELFDGSVLPFRIPENRATRWMFGTTMKLAAKSSKITAKMFA